MSEVEHTPGLWVADGHDICQTLHPDGGKCLHVIATAHIPLHDMTRSFEDICGANAHLIAAAPELLKACEEMIAIWNSGHESAMTAKAKMEAAIAKAKGQAA